MTSAESEEVRYFGGKQPGAQRRLLSTPLAELTVANLLRILEDLDQIDWRESR